MRLAPVDPRSLMQGDYMILNYDLTQRRWFSTDFDSIPKRGFALVSLEDSLGLIADSISFHAKKPIVPTGKYAIKVNFSEQVNQPLQPYAIAWQTVSIDN